jgi:hypothetical protein
MLTADGCLPSRLRYIPKRPGSGPVTIDYDRILNGQEKWVEGMEQRVCHDCNAKPGQYHHPGCDVERCPRCGGQMISCFCHEHGRFVDLMPVVALPQKISKKKVKKTHA